MILCFDKVYSLHNKDILLQMPVFLLLDIYTI